MRTINRRFEIAANPHKSSKAHAARKKGNTMAKGKSLKTAANHKKRPNPFKKKFEEMKARLRKANGSHNPSMESVIGRPMDLVTTGLAALGSAVATKQLPQLILSTGNTGVEGYGANIVTGIAATWAAGAFLGPTAAKGAMAGALVIILDRILTDQFSSLGPYLALSGVGDATSYGKLGTIRDGYYFHPSLVDGNGNMITPQPVLQDAVNAVVAQYPQLAAPIAQAVSTGGGGRGMGALNPGNMRRNMGAAPVMSQRFASRFGR